MKVLAKICRICLRSFEKLDELKSVFDNDDENIKIAKKIYDISGIFIERSPNIPERICKLCIKTLNVSYKFRLLCQESDIKLKSADQDTSCLCDQVEMKFNENDNFKIEPICKSDQNSQMDSLDHEIVTEEYQDFEIIDDDDICDEFVTTNEIENLFQKLPFEKTKIEPLHDIDNSSDILEFKCEKTDQSQSDEDDELKLELYSCEYLEELDELNENQTKSLIEEIPNIGNFTAENITIKKRARNKLNEWIQKYDFLEIMEDKKYVLCKSCNCQLTLSKGEAGILRHEATEKHKQKLLNGSINKNNKGEKVLICDICGNKYSSMYLLKKHLKYHSDIMDYECEICNKKFRQTMQLRRHMRMHTGEKPYSCKYCNKAIRDYSTKIRHERMHTGERPYVCPTCNKGFQYPFVLKNHMKIHTGEKLYQCAICNKNFTLKKHLTSHLETMIHKNRLLRVEGEKATQSNLEQIYLQETDGEKISIKI